MTIVFVEEAHASTAIVTAETQEECIEKYFLKYPDRREYIGQDALTISEGAEWAGWGLKPKEN